MMTNTARKQSRCNQQQRQCRKRIAIKEYMRKQNKKKPEQQQRQQPRETAKKRQPQAIIRKSNKKKKSFLSKNIYYKSNIEETAVKRYH